MAALVSVRGLVKVYRVSHGIVHAVAGVDFDVERGETVALVGESGCGKSTIGRCLLRLVKPDEGQVTFDGHEIQDLGHAALRPLRRRMQMVFQDPVGSLNPAYSTEATLRDALRPLGLPRPERRSRTVELLHQVGLDDRFLHRRPKEMSGGQLQRVGIARALATEPDFLFLDEPTSSLDLSVRGQIVNLLLDLQEEKGLTYVFASHDLAVVRFIAQRVIVMYLGRVVEAGPADQIFSDPRHPYTKALLIAAGIRTASGAEQQTVRGELTDAAADLSGCAYADRCAYVHDRCGAEPPLLDVTRDRQARCWLESDAPSAASHASNPEVAAIGDPLQKEG